MPDITPYKKLLLELESLEIRLSGWTCAVGAIHDAMENSGSDPSSYTDGLFAVWSALDDDMRQLKELVSKNFSILER